MAKQWELLPRHVNIINSFINVSLKILKVGLFRVGIRVGERRAPPPGREGGGNLISGRLHAKLSCIKSAGIVDM